MRGMQSVQQALSLPLNHQIQHTQLELCHQVAEDETDRRQESIRPNETQCLMLMDWDVLYLVVKLVCSQTEESAEDCFCEAG